MLDVAEAAKPKGRQPAKRKPPVAKEVEEQQDVMMDLAQRLQKYNIGSTSDNSSKIAIDLDEDDDVVVKVAQPAASPEKKVRKMRSSPFNKKSSSVLGRLGNEKKD